MDNIFPIYLDYMATTPVDPRVIEKMCRYLGPDGCFGNPASMTHVYGRQAAEAVEHARQQIAATVHAGPEEIIFTSGATEANNLAILGAAAFYHHKGKHVITLQTEHKSVLDSFNQLEKEGYKVTYLQPMSDGLLNLDTLRAALTEETLLVSIMHANNEIGVVQDIAAIGALLKKKGVLFHVDAAQSAGKLPINLDQWPVHLMSFSAHKNYGPKGIGALYVRNRPRVRLTPLSFGGGQERGLRSGTLATHQIVGMGEAFALSERLREQEQAHILKMRQKLWNGIKGLSGIKLHGHEEKRIAGNLNLTFAGISGESLLNALDRLALSTTSACAAASAQPSYVISALGNDQITAINAIRISLGRFTSEIDVPEIIALISKAHHDLSNPVKK